MLIDSQSIANYILVCVCVCSLIRIEWLECGKESNQNRFKHTECSTNTFTFTHFTLHKKELSFDRIRWSHLINAEIPCSNIKLTRFSLWMRDHFSWATVSNVNSAAATQLCINRKITMHDRILQCTLFHSLTRTPKILSIIEIVLSKAECVYISHAKSISCSALDW